MFWDQSTMIGHYEGYCDTHIGVLYKTPRVHSFWPTLLERYYSCPKGWSEVVVPFSRYLENVE